MIDPFRIVRYDYSDSELEELLVFCICVAGKKASVIAARVARFYQALQLLTGAMLPLKHLSAESFVPLHWRFASHIPETFQRMLQIVGIGCFNQKGNTIAHVGQLDLRTVTVPELESIKGIGPKTARFFVMSSREGVQHATLDIHILRWLAEQGVECVPGQTPTGKTYARLEQEFLDRVPTGLTPAEFDLAIWKRGHLGDKPI